MTLPDKKPEISGSERVYDLHRQVKLTCTSFDSKPASSLSYYINDEKVKKPKEKRSFNALV